MRAVTRLGLNRTELALAIGVSPNSVDAMVAEGALPAPRKWHSRKIWIVAEVEAAMFEWPADAPPLANDEDEASQWGCIMLPLQNRPNEPYIQYAVELRV